MSDTRLAAFYGRLERGLTAGRPLLFALREEQAAAHGAARRELARIIARIEEGQALADAAQDCPDLFPRAYAAVVAAGESSGTLPAVLNQLVRELDRRRELEARFYRALVQPIFLVLLVLFLVPLVPAYLEASVRSIDKSSSGSLLHAYLARVLPNLTWFCIGITALLVLALAVPARVVELTPMVGALVGLSQRARLAHLAAVALRAGLPIARVLATAAHATGSRALIARAESARSDIDAGATFHAAVCDRKLFPKEVRIDLEAGEASGKLDETLDRMAREWQDELSKRIAFLAKVGVLVLTVAMAVVAVWSVFAFLGAQASSALEALD